MAYVHTPDELQNRKP